MSKNLCTLLLALLLFSCGKSSDYRHSVSQWPELPTEILQGKSATPSQWRLINIWATWCLPCREEMPLLENLAAKLSADNFSLILITIDTDLNLVKEFSLTYNINSKIYVALQEDVERMLDISAYPATFLVAPDGKVVEVFIGAREWDSTEMIAHLRQQIASSGQ